MSNSTVNSDDLNMTGDSELQEKKDFLSVEFYPGRWVEMRCETNGIIHKKSSSSNYN